MKKKIKKLKNILHSVEDITEYVEDDPKDKGNWESLKDSLEGMLKITNKALIKLEKDVVKTSERT